jgi:methionine synthase II (cobalamin-independent)
MFATFAGGYSRRPNPGLEDVLRDAETAVREGRLDEAGLRDVADGFVREVLEEQAVVQLAIVGEGGVRAPDRVLPLIHGLAGLAAGEATTLPDGEAATRPIVTGPIHWTASIHARDWEFADGESDLIVKQTLLGPYTLAALTEPALGPARANLAAQFGEALGEELAALAGVGCQLIEIDEPLVLQIGDDAAEWHTVRAAHERLTADLQGDDAPHLSLGLWGGHIHPAGHATLIDAGYKSFLVDVLAGPSAWRFINAVPADLGIIVGSADAGSEAMDETEVHVWAMAWAAQGERGASRVGCAPNGALSRIGRHFAHRKCSRLGEAVNIAAMGPLHDVALALDEQPLISKMAELRTMAQAVEASRGA